ncbi:unnamed protein product [Rotaria sp. Silwood1]|nr:unnamed protein product [Rotaria sp. Silwood1]CAF5011736.1 unnamed protein product [Rotaria sp. Silwood1]
MTFHQAEHPLLVIPGPIEVSDDVLLANASPSQSHMSKKFTETFGEAIKMLRKVLVTDRGQPFIVGGSGTLGWDMVAANLMEEGDEALVLHSGYFGQSFADCFAAYGIKATQLKAPIGQCLSREEITEALKAKKYKVVTMTHVDTSTGVLIDARTVAEVVPANPSIAANGMTAIYFPDGLLASDIIPRMLERGVVVAGGLHKDIKDKYFRIGHMGISVTDTINRHDMERVKNALKDVLQEAGYVGGTFSQNNI